MANARPFGSPNIRRLKPSPVGPLAYADREVVRSLPRADPLNGFLQKRRSRMNVSRDLRGKFAERSHASIQAACWAAADGNGVTAS